MKKIENIKFETEELKNEIINGNVHYKMIILVIASTNKHYDIFTECWRGYMNKFQDVRSFFLYNDETIDCDILIKQDSITYNAEESYIPGILYKTIAGYFCCMKYFSFDYALRTNLSSFIEIRRLLAYLQNCDKTRFIGSRIERFNIIDKNDTTKFDDNTEENKQKWITYTDTLVEFFNDETFIENNKTFNYFAGSFIIFSKDVVHMLLCKIIMDNVLSIANIANIPDDIVLTIIAKMPELGIKSYKNILINSYDCEKIEETDNYKNNVFHIRNRTDYYYNNRETDIINIISQVKHFYGRDIIV